MDEEVLQNKDFTELVGDVFIYYKVDFPIRKLLPEKERVQNEALKTQFGVKGFPTIILLDASLKPFDKLNYREGGGKLYGEYVLKLLREHQKFNKDMKSVTTQNAADLEKLYQYASSHSFEKERLEILAAGSTSSDASFFLKEQYRDLLACGQQETPDAKNIKGQLLKLDPDNKKHIQYDIAVAEFENNAKKLEKNSAQEIVQPLQEYLSKFGDRDDKNRWKVEMIISQAYLNNHQIDEALLFARASYTHAPAREKIQISGIIVDLEHTTDLIGAQDDE